MTLVLASSSPRRSELLGRAGIQLVVLASDVDETVLAGEAPRAYVARVAAAKAAVGHAKRPDAHVLAADTTVVIDDEILGKPEDAEDARRMLVALSARRHLVLTATVIVAPGGTEHRRVVETAVDFRRLDAAEIDSYLRGGEWRGKAGAYAAQGQAAGFMAEVHGSFTNIVGLPLAETLEDLARLGIATPSYAR